MGDGWGQFAAMLPLQAPVHLHHNLQLGLADIDNQSRLMHPLQCQSLTAKPGRHHALAMLQQASSGVEL